RFSAWYMKPQDRDGLRKRTECHRRVANWTHGLLGRSPDHVASLITGLSMSPEMFEANRAGFGNNIVACYNEMRRKDLFSSYVVLPPQAPRNPTRYDGKASPSPALQVTAEKDDGVLLNGIKLLGTAAVFSDMTWIGNLSPLAPDQKAQAVTCA